MNNPDKSKIPARVRNCTTHHKACACREWQYEQMERALKVIYTWTLCPIESTKDCDIRKVHNLCEKTLMDIGVIDECT